MTAGSDAVPAEHRLRRVLQELGAALEELRVAEEELTTRSEQLAASAATVDRERERYLELFEFASDGSLETDERGTILRANRSAADLLGVAAAHLRGMQVGDFVETRDRRRFHRMTTDAAAGAAPSEEVLALRTRDGREVVAGVTVARQAHPSTTTVQLRWLVRDITARTELESYVEELEGEVDLLTRTAEVQSLLAGSDPLADTLRGLVDVAERVLPGCQIGVSPVGRPDMPVLATGARAEALDALQRAADEGPWVVARRRAETVRARPADWPVIADATDVAEVVGVPLIEGDEVTGVLTVYALDAPLDDHAMHLLELLGRQATVALRNTALYTAASGLAEGLTRALATRGVIERAKGILMARDGIDADAAFALLRTASQRENEKLHLVAERLVERRSCSGGAGPDGGPGPRVPAL